MPVVFSERCICTIDQRCRYVISLKMLSYFRKVCISITVSSTRGNLKWLTTDTRIMLQLPLLSTCIWLWKMNMLESFLEVSESHLLIQQWNITKSSRKCELGLDFFPLVVLAVLKRFSSSVNVLPSLSFTVRNLLIYIPMELDSAKT